MNFDLLKKLSDINATATQEGKVNTFISENIQPFADEIYYDDFGNLIARKMGDGPKVMLAAHTDQIGFMISHIEENGVLRFAETGFLLPTNIIGQRVVIQDNVIGVVGTDIKDGSITMKTPKEKYFIDIGVTSKAEAQAKVQVGDFGNFYSQFYHNEDIIIAKAVDDRIGCFILIEVAAQLKKHGYDIYFAFTSQEETGLRGAKTATYGINPEYGIAVDITGSDDIPGNSVSTAKLGKGVGIKLMDPSLIIHPEMKKQLINLAEKHQIPYQLEIMNRGGTDAGAIHTTHVGVKSASISIPTRHGHSANEICMKKDVDSAIKLLVRFLESHL